jgi:hypothetical protein
MSYGAPFHWEFDGDSTQISQSFEQLICERENLENYETSNSIFKCIKEKLFAINEINPQIEKKDELDEKYQSKTIIKTIDTLKKSIAELYTEKLKVDAQIDKYMEKYKNFLKSINEVIKKMELIEENTSEDDQFRASVIDRVEWYYRKLGIEDLLKQQKSVGNEFNYLKGLISELSGISNPVLCQICFVNQVSFFVNPCGHTLCESCKNKCQNITSLTNCHYCRSEIISINKLFL